MARYMPVISAVLVVLAFFAGRVSIGRSVDYADYYAKAADAYDTAVRLDSPPADANDPERWARVLALYRHVFDGFPDSPYADDALHTIAARIDIQSDADTAFALYRRLLNDYPDSEYAPQALNSVGVAHFQRGDYDRALALFDRFLQEYPANALVEDVTLNHALCQLEKDDFDKAIDELHVFTERFPMTDKIPATVFYVGKAFFAKQDFEKARANFTSIVAIADPEYAPAAQFNIGQTYFSERNYDEAIAAYRRTIEIYPDSDSAQEATFRIGWALERKQQYAEAVTELKSATEKYPNSPNTPAAYAFMARIYLDALKNPRGAIEMYRAIADATIPLESIETDRRSAYDVRRNAQYQIGKIHEDRGEIAEAVTEYEKLLAQFGERHSDPKHPSNLIDEAYIVDLKRNLAGK